MAEKQQTTNATANGLAPLSAQRHQDVRIKPMRDFAPYSQRHLMPLVAEEFPRAAGNFPVVFLYDEGQDSYNPYALMGLQEGVNGFVDAQGRWLAGYVPAYLRKEPFVLAQSPEGQQEQGQQQFVLCLNENSPLVSQQEGQPLFDDQGQAGEVVDRARQLLQQLEQGRQRQQQLFAYLREKELIQPLNLQLTQGGQNQRIGGLYAVAEEAFNKLGNDDFLQLRQRGVLPLIYAHLFSLQRLQEVARRTELKQQSTRQDAANSLEDADRFAF